MEMSINVNIFVSRVSAQQSASNLVVGSIMLPVPTYLPPRFCEYITLPGKREFADVTQLRILR